MNLHLAHRWDLPLRDCYERMLFSYSPTFSTSIFLSAHFHPLPLTSGSRPPSVLCPLPMQTRYLAVRGILNYSWCLKGADVCGKYWMNKLYDSRASKSRRSKENQFFFQASICHVFGQWFSLAQLFAQEMLKKLIFIIAASAWQILV